MTDVERVLRLFRDHTNIEINHRMIVDDLHISEYTGRITDARDKLGCTCGRDKKSCTALEHIVNTRKGYYRFVSKTPVWKPAPVVVTLGVDQQLAKLRQQYKQAKARGDEVQMDVIKRLAERIKNPPKDYFLEDVKSSLF